MLFEFLPASYDSRSHRVGRDGVKSCDASDGAMLRADRCAGKILVIPKARLIARYYARFSSRAFLVVQLRLD
jgi:hypothetical protein